MADLPQVVQEYLGGKTIEEIAKGRASRRTIYRWLLSGLGGERYYELVTECLVARVSDADEELEAARASKDAVRVAAARETARFARMDLERRRPGLYGPKQEVNHKGNAPQLVVMLAAPEGGVGRVLEGTPVSSALPAPAGGAVEVVTVNGESDGIRQE